MLLTGGTTVRAEQGDGVGDEEEVGDGSWLGQRGRAGEAEQDDRGQRARRHDAEPRTSSGERARRREKSGSGRPALHADPGREGKHMDREKD